MFRWLLLLLLISTNLVFADPAPTPVLPSGGGTVDADGLDNVFTTTGLLRRTGAATYDTVTDSSSNWNDAYTYRLTGASGTSPLNLTLNANSLTGSIDQVDTDTSGYLSFDDWNTFNNKVSSQWVTQNTTNVSLAAGNAGIGTTFTTTSALSVMNGNVGIGTWKPTSSLNIRGGGIALGTNTSAGTGVLIATGNVAIGSTSTANANLEIRSANTNSQFIVTNTSTAGASSGSGLVIGQDDGAAAMTTGQRAAFIVARGNYNTSGGTVNGAAISFFTKGTLSVSSAPMEIRFQTAPSGSTSRGDRLIISETGNVGLGTATFNGNIGIGTATAPQAIYAVGTIEATTGFKASNAAGITDNTTYWLCTTALCATTCQATIKGGIITGCP